MPKRSRPEPLLPRDPRRLLKQGAVWLGIFAAAAFVGAILFAWSGLYSVAATKGHFVGFEIFLEFGMRSSVRTHAMGIETPANLDDPALIERGAGHFQGACTPCHGGPGQQSSAVVTVTTPHPPDLARSVPTWESHELFWIVKHGLKYTGMPGWPTQRRDDEIWSMVAFLRNLPTLDTESYNALSSLDPPDQPLPDEILARHGPVGTALPACTRCHGLDGRGRDSGAFPRLDIQSADYLFEQLRAYADGSRESGIMGPVATELTIDQMRQLAAHYSAQSPAPVAAQDHDKALLALGETLVMTGLPDADLPACISCHGDDTTLRHPLYPSLAGQYATIVAQQLQLFRAGARDGTPAGQIMSVIAKRLSDEQIAAVAAFLETQAPQSLLPAAP